MYSFRGPLFLFALLSLVYVGRFNYPSNKVKQKYSEHVQWVDYNQNRNYNENGFIAGFLSNLDAPPMQEITGYSYQKIESIYDKYSNIAKIHNKDRSSDLSTNIIFIMNESFSDPLKLNGLSTNKDPLTNYREILNNTLSGNVLASNIGGGTATSEFQALTGFSMEPFSSHVNSPFIQLTARMDDYPSLAKKFKNYNYQTTAIHPYLSSFYRRNDVYNKLSFDSFRHQDNMKNTDKISSVHRYISDYSTYLEIFDVLESTEESDFIHVVTMQNHTTYQEKYEYVNFEVEGSGNDDEASAYLQDLDNSDFSLRYLFNRIESFEEPILLVFWGDHLPGFYTDEIKKLNEDRIFYETPFIIYSNQYELDGEIELISPHYLWNFITKTLPAKISPYETLLLELEQHIPVLDKRMYIERQSVEELSSRDNLSNESLEVLKDYTMLMYDITSGKKYSEQFNFFD